MKLQQTLKSRRGFAALVGGFALFTGSLHAAPFLYTQGDLVLGFRQTGNTYDYVVNIGKATNYNNVPSGTSFVVTNFSLAQFNTAFPGGLNGVSWSVAGGNRLPNLNPNIDDHTLWVTKSRDYENPDTQSAPWVRFGYYSQGSSGAQIDVVGLNAAAYSSSGSSNANNGVYGVIIPATSVYAFTPIITSGGNYDANFQGNIENTTPDDFTDDSASVTRSDFYELTPGDGSYPPGRYLGYFELTASGTLTFNTLTAAAAQPHITGITRSGGVSTISFITDNGPTYRLRYTNAAGLTSPVSTWSVGASVTGTGSVLSLQDTNASDIVFYAIEVLH